MDHIRAAIDQLYKTCFGQLVASLLAFSKDIDLATAEDIVQEAFSTALVEWQRNGTPVNQSGWMYTVCRNKALNHFKKLRTSSILLEMPGGKSEPGINESLLEDYQLKMLFACANPDLPPKSQVAITLKYVVNLKVEAIARLLGITVDGVDKILVRARQKIKSGSLLQETSFNLEALKSRLSVVHKIIYLVFNEGYRSSWGKEIIREELCEEALLLSRSLLESGVANNDTLALHALMLFNSSRIRSRFNSAGEIIELENQDRSLWDANLIALAVDFLDRSRSDTISSYHIEASIAYLHCSAINFESTNWPLIVKLYQQLLHNNPNPFVEMNYAIALFYSGNSESAFMILKNLQQHPFLSQYFLLNAALGKLYLLSGDTKAAKKFLLVAYSQTTFIAEKNHIQKLLDSIGTY